MGRKKKEEQIPKSAFRLPLIEKIYAELYEHLRREASKEQFTVIELDVLLHMLSVRMEYDRVNQFMSDIFANNVQVIPMNAPQDLHQDEHVKDPPKDSHLYG